jgi:hypothetical protein
MVSLHTNLGGGKECDDISDFTVGAVCYAKYGRLLRIKQEFEDKRNYLVDLKQSLNLIFF